MAFSDELASFIASTFQSVWGLELLLLLKREQRTCSTDELVDLLRASPSVVDNALTSLIAAGVAGNVGDGVAYMPVSADVASLVEETERIYRSRPDRVRRLIIAASNTGLAAFSDAFRLKD
jgi:DNA-binding IclR family transcriptional regulator